MRHITFAILSIFALFGFVAHAQPTPIFYSEEGIYEAESLAMPYAELSTGWSVVNNSGRSVLRSTTIGNTIRIHTTAQWLIIERFITGSVANNFRVCYSNSREGVTACNANVSNGNGGSGADQYATVGYQNPFGIGGDVYWIIENRGNGVSTNTNFHLDKIYLLQGSIVVYPTPTPQPTATPQFTATPYTVTPQPTATPAYTATPQPYLVMVVPFVVTAEGTQEAMSVDSAIADYVEATDELGSPVVLGRVDRSLTGGDIVIIMLLASLLLVMLVLLGVTLWRN